MVSNSLMKVTEKFEPNRVYVSSSSTRSSPFLVDLDNIDLTINTDDISIAIPL